MIKKFQKEQEAALKAFEHWRATRKKRTPMPEELVNIASDMVQKIGAYQTHKLLRVNHATLIKLKESPPQKLDFVELPRTSFSKNTLSCKLNVSKGKSEINIAFDSISEESLLNLVSKLGA